MIGQSTSHLSFWKARLGHAPDEIWEHTGLETLVLAENDLTELSERVGGLKKLRMLDLGHNALMQVPEAPGISRALRIFYISTTIA